MSRCPSHLFSRQFRIAKILSATTLYYKPTSRILTSISTPINLFRNTMRFTPDPGAKYEMQFVQCPSTLVLSSRNICWTCTPNKIFVDIHISSRCTKTRNNTHVHVLYKIIFSVWQMTDSR